MKNVFLITVLFFLVTCVFTSCEKNDGPEPEPEAKGAYVVAAVGDAGSYLIQTDDIASGALSTANGSENATPTVWWVHDNKTIYGLTYAQGNPGMLVSYELDANGALKKRSLEYETPRFTTYGSYGKYLVTSSALATGITIKDPEGKDVPAQGVTTTLIDTESQVKHDAVIISTENFLGNGEYVTFSGIVEANGKLYTGICPLGVSAYGALKGYNGGEARSGTAFVDSVWVAVYSDQDFTKTPKILKDNRLSYSATRFRSQYYKNIVSDDKNNVYVFSARNESTSTKPSGVIRIPAGSEAFDSFYFNIEGASGGLRLFNVWHITGDYFFLQMMTTAESTGEDAKKFAIFNAAGSGSFTWITGMPAADKVGSFAKTPLADGGKFYMPVTTTDADAAIYEVDPVTATAVKGVTVNSTSISAVGRLTY